MSRAGLYVMCVEVSPPEREKDGARQLLHGYSKRVKQLPWSYLLAYAAPMIGAGGMNFTLTTFAAYLYTDTMGVSAGESRRIMSRTVAT